MQAEALREFELQHAAHTLADARAMPKDWSTAEWNRTCVERHRSATAAIEEISGGERVRLTDLQAPLISTKPDPWPEVWVAQGLCIVYGQPGSGKSTLIAYEADRMTKEGMNVLLIPTQGEDRPVDLLNRYRDTEVEALFVNTEDWLCMEGNRVTRLENMLRTLNTDVLIIDSMSGLDANLDFNDQSAVKSLLGKLSRLAVTADCCVVLVAHGRKGKGTGIDMLAGSVQIAATARTVLEVTGTEEGNIVAEMVKTNIKSTFTTHVYQRSDHKVTRTESDTRNPRERRLDERLQKAVEDWKPPALGTKVFRIAVRDHLRKHKCGYKREAFIPQVYLEVIRGPNVGRRTTCSAQRSTWRTTNRTRRRNGSKHWPRSRRRWNNAP